MVTELPRTVASIRIWSRRWAGTWAWQYFWILATSVSGGAGIGPR